MGNVQIDNLVWEAQNYGGLQDKSESEAYDKIFSLEYV
jgi:hypothetical protein